MCFESEILIQCFMDTCDHKTIAHSIVNRILDVCEDPFANLVT